MNKQEKSLWSQYGGAARIFGKYWKAYGGWRAVRKSPYIGAASLITVLSFGLWWDGDWCDTALSVLPNLLGFSLGGYAMLVGFGDDKFKALLSETPTDDDETVVFMGVSASFVHFIVVQALALIIALISKALAGKPVSEISKLVPSLEGTLVVLSRIGWALGFLIFAYALTLTVASTMSIFRLTDWLTQANAKKRPPKSGT